MFDLTGKVAVVTGGNGGIGLGMAGGLARAGATVVLAGRNAEKSSQAVADLKTKGFSADAIQADVTDEHRVARLFQDVMQEFQQVMDVNLTSTFLCCRAAHALMKVGGAGKIINIGSMLSLLGAPYASAYGASKGGVVQFTRSIATAWAADNIQCNAVLPGWIDTELTQGARQQVAGLYERILARTPAGRWGNPADLAGIAVFLASRASDFVTGTAIPVDGGYSIA